MGREEQTWCDHTGWPANTCRIMLGSRFWWQTWILIHNWNPQHDTTWLEGHFRNKQKISMLCCAMMRLLVLHLNNRKLLQGLCGVRQTFNVLMFFSFYCLLVSIIWFHGGIDYLLKLVVNLNGIPFWVFFWKQWRVLRYPQQTSPVFVCTKKCQACTVHFVSLFLPNITIYTLPHDHVLRSCWNGLRLCMRESSWAVSGFCVWSILKDCRHFDMF